MPYYFNEYQISQFSLYIFSLVIIETHLDFLSYYGDLCTENGIITIYEKHCIMNKRNDCNVLSNNIFIFA